MHFAVIADTDVGIVKKTNQDSLLVKHAESAQGEILLAVICDGMGGLAKGEAASATVIRTFSEWFDTELRFELERPDMHVIGGKWALILKDLNIQLLEYGQKHDLSLGTTFTGILFIKDEFVVVHVGDTRAYYLGKKLEQLTTDQTFVEREVRRGNMTLQQAKTDKRRNMLLQCVGASEKVEPEIIVGKTQSGMYMLCSDGFRHEISEKEIYDYLNQTNSTSKESMRKNVRYLIDQGKKRQEKDNISTILINVE